MQMRALGRSGIKIAPLMFGGNVFGWTSNAAMSHTLLDAFVDHGFNAVDTADVYSAWAPGHVGGESETVLGTWLAGRGRRSKVVVATKLGMLAPNNGLKRSQIEAAVDASLRRLQTDYIDLYQAHRDDETTPPEETLGAFDALLKAGKIRAVGASNFTPERLKTALDVSAAKGFARFESLQPEYNLASRAKFEGAVQDLCIAEDVGVITYSSLASGFLTGKYRTANDVSKSPRGKAAAERFLNPRGEAILEALDAVSEARGAAPAEIALAWLIAQPGVTAAIASATNPDQLAALMKGAVLQLTPGELDALSASSV